jgi:hypothetical protein
MFPRYIYLGDINNDKKIKELVNISKFIFEYSAKNKINSKSREELSEVGKT